MTCPGLVKIRLELLATTFLSSKIEADSFEYHDSYRRGCDPTHWSVSPVATREWVNDCFSGRLSRLWEGSVRGLRCCFIWMGILDTERLKNETSLGL
uniref:uncharacterized protein LOC101299869 isoform X2 n=1 Tax=Fragaria vesca subsp. vesca TaxID=101020 RepID=UPI0005CB7769|nr:PREDICTED: uncharacterized protein LOC101299869 isoform X2 [Fragaria vesca subsp. vesca]